MDLKGFVTGAICGAAAYAAVTTALRDPEPPVPATGGEPGRGALHARPTMPSQDAAAPLEGSEHLPSASVETPFGQSSTEATNSAGSTAETQVSAAPVAGASNTPVPRTERKPRRPTSVEPGADAFEAWHERALSKLRSEPKDESWAQYMELAVGQFLAAHPASPEFDIAYAECRTTRCQIKAIGYDESTEPTWQRVMYDMSLQPWFEFGQRGASSATIRGRLVIIQDLYKTPPSSEE